MSMRLLIRAVWLCSLIELGYIAANSIVISKVSSHDLTEQRALFKQCWGDIYQNHSFQQLGFLHAAYVVQELFDREELDYKSQVGNRLFFQAVMDDKLVGYLSVEIKEKQAVYIRQIALLPEVCTTDQLRELIFALFDYVDNIACIHMTLHKIALSYLQISKEIGFVSIAGTDASLWEHLAMICNKCGTCLCDLDYAGLDEDLPLYEGELDDSDVNLVWQEE